MKRILIAIACLVSGSLMAQNPGVGKTSKESIVYHNARIFVGNVRSMRQALWW